MILLNLMMPVMDSIEFRCRQLSDPNIAKTPVVIITGKANLNDVRQLRPISVMSRPFRMHQLVNLIETHRPL